MFLPWNDDRPEVHLNTPLSYSRFRTAQRLRHMFPRIRFTLETVALLADHISMKHLKNTSFDRVYQDKHQLHAATPYQVRCQQTFVDALVPMPTYLHVFRFLFNHHNVCVVAKTLSSWIPPSELRKPRTLAYAVCVPVHCLLNSRTPTI